MNHRNADAAAPVEQPLVGSDDAGSDIGRSRHGGDRHVEMTAMQVNGHDGGLGTIDTEIHGFPHSRAQIPKFADYRGGLGCELRNQSSSSNLLILVRL